MYQWETAWLRLPPKHPDRWDRVVKCMTNKREDGPTLKEVLLDFANQRNVDDVAKRVKYYLSSILDLPAKDAQYHKRCYDAFTYIPKSFYIAFCVR